MYTTSLYLLHHAHFLLNLHQQGTFFAILQFIFLQYFHEGIEGLIAVRVTAKSLRWGNGSGMIRGWKMQFGVGECDMKLTTTGCEYSTEVWR